MKTLALKSASAVMLVLTALAFSSCDLFESADDVSFSTTLSKDILAAETSSGENVAYDQVITLDATSDPDINEYKSKIKGFKINKLSYKVTEFTGAFPTTFSGELGFGDASGATSTVAATITNLNLQTAFNAGTEFELTIDQADIDEVQAMLKSDKAVKIYLDGTLSQTPVYFTIEVILDVTIEADAL